MSDQKGLGSKLLGIFVESGDGAQASTDDADKSPAEIVAELAQKGGGASAPGRHPPAGPAAPGEAPPPGLKLDKMSAPSGEPGAPLDFNAIFQGAGMDPGELDRVKKAEDLLKSLPESTPQAVKRQIVEASLKAFGFDVAKIVQAAQNQKRALDAYVKVNESGTAKAITDAQQQIQSFEEKIAKLRDDIQRKTAQLSSVTAAAQNRKAEVQRVLEFFSSGEPPPPAAQGKP